MWKKNTAESTITKYTYNSEKNAVLVELIDFYRFCGLSGSPELSALPKLPIVCSIPTAPPPGPVLPV